MVLVGGGTGGHVTPLVALAEEIKLQHPRWRIQYLGAANDKIAHRLTKNKNLFASRHFIKAGKWHRFGKVKLYELFFFWRADFWRNIGNFFLFKIGFYQSLVYLYRQRPDILFSKGGYAAFGPCLAALILRIPLILHDSDAVSGAAHSPFKRYAKMCLSGFKIKITDKERQRHVGIPVNPVFAEKLKSEQKERVLAKYNLPKTAKFILVTGGGGGARSLNEGILKTIDQLKIKHNTYIVIVTGSRYYSEAKERATKIKSRNRVRVVEFADDMPDLVRASLGVVTRAGATILTESTLAQKATIIVPNPLLPRAHQLHNARIYQQANAAWLISERNQRVNLRALKQALDELINDSIKRASYERNIAKLIISNSTQLTLLAVEDVLMKTLGVIDINPDQRAALKKSSKQKDLKQIVSSHQHPRHQNAFDNFKKFLKYSILIILVSGFLIKIFYIGPVKLELIDESPLLGERELTALESEIDDLLSEQNFFRRHFFLQSAPLYDLLLEKGYIEEVDFRRDIARSEIIISIQPKYILGSFVAPNLETIITTDGYAVKGYEHLLDKGTPSLRIKSTLNVREDQQLILSPLDVSFLNQINTYLASEGYKLEEAYISTQPREMIFRLRDIDLDVIAITTRDPIEQGIALVIALNFFANPEDEEATDLLEPAEDTAAQDELVQPIEYIDVRLIDRVIYK